MATEASLTAPAAEKAYLVGAALPGELPGEAEALLEELAELVRNLGIEICGREIVHLRQASPRFLIGSGRMEAIQETLQAQGITLLIFDNELHPSQQRNWEKALEKVRVIDRQEVILEIFAQRAHTREAVLQVELARTEHALPRLRRAWTHLSRQRGGGVTQRGEGEKQIQLDKRMVRDRIAQLKEELTAVVRHRQVQRAQRMKVPVPSAAIVGYTNAGKSSLLNAFTGADVLAEDRLFATLDPTTRRLELPGGQKLLLTDTVGFIQRLPHQLVNAFRATLEEALVADFLVLVVDAASPDAEKHLKTTQQVLAELGAGEQPALLVFNKMDCVADPILEADLARRHPGAIFISVKTGKGLDTLAARMSGMIENHSRFMRLVIPHSRYDLIGLLYRSGSVQEEKAEEDGVHIQGYIPPALMEKVRPFEQPSAVSGKAVREAS